MFLCAVYVLLILYRIVSSFIGVQRYVRDIIIIIIIIINLSQLDLQVIQL